MLYFNYLQRKTLNQFLSIATILISLIWFSRAISFMKYVTENGIAMGDFFYLFILILPWLLMFIIPVSLFIAVLLIYYNLLKNNEISILKNAGLSKLMIARPVIILSVIITFISYFLTFYIMPYANKELRLMKVDFVNNYATMAFNPNSFETINNLTIYVKDKDENNRLYGVMINDKRSKLNSITITAQTGDIITKSDAIYLIMKNGTVQRYNYQKKNSEILYFQRYVFNLKHNRNVSSVANWKPKEKYFHELLYNNESMDKKNISKIRSEIHERISYPLLSIILTLIACTCVLCKEYNRRNDTRNIILAILLAIFFMLAIIMFYELIERSAIFIPFLYFFKIICILICIKFLHDSNIKNNEAIYK